MVKKKMRTLWFQFIKQKIKFLGTLYQDMYAKIYSEILR